MSFPIPTVVKKRQESLLRITYLDGNMDANSTSDTR